MLTNGDAAVAISHTKAPIATQHAETRWRAARIPCSGRHILPLLRAEPSRPDVSKAHPAAGVAVVLQGEGQLRGMRLVRSNLGKACRTHECRVTLHQNTVV